MILDSKVDTLLNWSHVGDAPAKWAVQVSDDGVIWPGGAQFISGALNDQDDVTSNKWYRIARANDAEEVTSGWSNAVRVMALPSESVEESALDWDSPDLQPPFWRVSQADEEEGPFVEAVTVAGDVYAVNTLTPGQWARVQAVYPNGQPMSSGSLPIVVA